MASRAQLLAVAVLALVGSTMAVEKKKKGSTPLTLFQTLNSTQNYTEVANLLIVAGLENYTLYLNNTVFAPTNLAIEDAITTLTGLGYNESFLSDNPSVLEDVLKYHIVPNNTVVADDIVDGEQLVSLQGEKITFAVDNGTVMIVGPLNATVRATPLNISGDTKVNSIDSLLLPPSLGYLLKGPPANTTVNSTGNSTSPPPPNSAAAFRVAPMAVAAAFLLAMVL